MGNKNTNNNNNDNHSGSDINNKNYNNFVINNNNFDERRGLAEATVKELTYTGISRGTALYLFRAHLHFCRPGKWQSPVAAGVEPEPLCVKRRDRSPTRRDREDTLRSVLAEASADECYCSEGITDLLTAADCIRKPRNPGHGSPSCFQNSMAKVSPDLPEEK
ncbi:uncharacterized protein LOC143026801 [Oratosquilla oratoria]|uniref:uncharacterized protein LOC143026801 n=1 Tax=Oratosquilla oratoria TaxID=337810 RepID=UPI003F769270